MRCLKANLRTFAVCLSICIAAIGHASPGKSSSSNASNADSPSDPVTLKQVEIGGSGCKNADASAANLLDNQTLTLDLKSLKASAGSTKSMAESRKFCQATILLNYPTGWTLAVAEVRGKLKLDLAKNQSAEIGVEAYTTGETSPSKKVQSWQGIKDQVVEFGEALDPIQFQPCPAQKPLNVKVALKLSGREAGEAQIAEPAVVELRWQKCKP